MEGSFDVRCQVALLHARAPQFDIFADFLRQDLIVETAHPLAANLEIDALLKRRWSARAQALR